MLGAVLRLDPRMKPVEEISLAAAPVDVITGFASSLNPVEAFQFWGGLWVFHSLKSSNGLRLRTN